MKLLITGANGQLGSELNRRRKETSFQFVLTDCFQPDKESTIKLLDITDPAAIEKAFRDEKPDLLINAAAYTQVDRAESEPDRAFGINAEAPGLLALCCAEAGIPMIQVSTDYVFNGKGTQAYTESSDIGPINVYGKSKAEGEAQVRQCLDRHLILRTSWLYAATGQNFVKTMLSLGKEKPAIRVVSDQIGSPTAAGDLAAVILMLSSWIAEHNEIPWGTYHYSGLGAASWFGFVEKIFEIAHRIGYPFYPRILPIPMSEYPTPAIRPAFSMLDCGLITRTFGICPVPWQESLYPVIQELLSSP